MEHLKKSIHDYFDNKNLPMWNEIRKEIAEKIVSDLLNSLNEFADPQGKEFNDLKSSFIHQYLKRKGA